MCACTHTEKRSRPHTTPFTHECTHTYKQAILCLRIDTHRSTYHAVDGHEDILKLNLAALLSRSARHDFQHVDVACALVAALELAKLGMYTRVCAYVYTFIHILVFYI
jgi:hypothetical protein